MRRTGRLHAAAAAAALVLATGPFATPSPADAADGDIPVDVELVLAVDVSMSMDMEEQRLQRQGYVQALMHPLVHRAIEDGLHGQIAVTYVEWAGVASQHVLVDWMLVDGAATAEELADILAEAPLSRSRRTSISAAIDFSASLFASNGYRGERQVIDISGDGPNNQGRLVTEARDEAVARGIVINGLPFVTSPGGSTSLFDLADLDIYYADCVIGGPGSFSIPIYAKEEFVEAIRNKLVLEIAGVTPTFIPAAATAPRVPCDAGERTWYHFMGPSRSP